MTTPPPAGSPDPPDDRPRCAWGDGADPAYRAYHDEEWGVPVRDERHLFELLILEGAQAGLSWSTILHKRDGYRRAFAGFDPAAVAAFGDADVERLLADAGDRAQPGEDRRGDRQRAGDARAARGRLDPRRSTCGRSSAARPWRTRGRRWPTIPAETDASRAMSRDLKRPGLPVRRADDLLRADAVRRPGQRPRRRLLPLPRGAGRLKRPPVSGRRARRRGA